MVYILRGMQRLNYHHLLYFFTVAREGSIARASQHLGLKQPTISAQIHQLEKQLGRPLLERNGRGLRITADGQTVLRYAESIFAIGGELVEALDAAPAPEHLVIGMTAGLPSGLAERLLRPVLALRPAPFVQLVEGERESLLDQLSARSLHLLLTDSAPEAGRRRSFHSQTLCESPLHFFAPELLARRLRRNFPASLERASLLLPASGAIAVELQRWHESHPGLNFAGRIPRPELYAASASALAAAPLLLRQHWKAAYGLHSAGELSGARWRLLAVTANQPPAALALILAAAREWK